MRRKIFYVVVIVGFLGFQPSIMGQKKNSALTLGISYTGDLVSNLKGGIQTGTTYLGMATIDADFDTEKANWWKGGKTFIKIANTHGGEPTATLVGDFQGVSNIEAGNLTWLYELWYKQSIGNFSITAGLQDLNINFAASENGVLFTNSSFGVHSSIADNIPAPIFPLTALGVDIEWQISKNYLLKAAIFDGTPDEFENNPFNVNWKIGKTDGYLAVSELQVQKSLVQKRNACYKLGVYFHEHNDLNIGIERNKGFYFVGDQEITHKLSAFTQVGLSPKKTNQHNHFYSLGINYKGLFDKREDDRCGLALAYAGIDGNSLGSETAIELTYCCNICSNIYIRPDIQYIINPAGTETKLGNALVGFVRFGLNF